MNTAIRYGGRAAGAYLAFRFLSSKIGSGPWAIAGAVAIGWLAGGLAADAAASKVAP